LMQVFFLGQGRMAGKLGDKSGSVWNASIRWTNELQKTELESLAKDLLPEGEIPEGTWLTTFEDHARHRPPEDLFFELAAEQTPIVPPPHIVVTHITYLPGDLIVLGLILVGFVVWKAFKRKKTGIEAQ